MPNTMFILRGVSGSGKSTFAKTLGGYVCSADDYFVQEDDTYKFDPAKLGDAHGRCLRLAKELARGSSTDPFIQPIKIIIDNTNTTVKEMSPYYQIGKEHGFQVVVVTFTLPSKNRNVHGVTDEKVAKQWHKIVSNPVPKDWDCLRYTLQAF